MGRIASILIIFSVLLTWRGYSDVTPYGGNSMERGIELYNSGHYRAALKEFRESFDRDKILTAGDKKMLEFYIANCSARLGEDGAVDLLEQFRLNYPGSEYADSAVFAIGNIYYEKRDYTRAVASYTQIQPYLLKGAEKNELWFKAGHSQFMLGNYPTAKNYLPIVDRNSEYGVHARYLLAYMDYSEGNYTAAKRTFNELRHNTSYSAVIPFYLLQIEFLEGNYDYVVREGEPLFAAATGERKAEIARILAESWFQKNDFNRTIEYLNHFMQGGGRMNRQENYLAGYSYYELGDYDKAEEHLSNVVGYEDRLSQNASYHLAGLYLRKSDKVRALQSFAIASQGDYDKVIKEDATFNYGKLQYELGGGVFNEAVNILTRYIQNYPDSPRVSEAREYLAAAYFNSKNYDAAYENIKRIQDPDNNMKAALQKIAYFRALEYIAQGNDKMAAQLLDEAASYPYTARYNALIKFWQGELEYKKENYDKAINLYRQYINLAPDGEEEKIMANYNIGYSYFNTKKYGDASTSFNRFVTAYGPNDAYKADAYNRIGDSEYAVREFGRAVSAYEKAISIGGQEGQYGRFKRAVSYGLTGDRNRQVSELKTIGNERNNSYAPDALYELGRTYISNDNFRDGATVLKQLTDTYPNSTVFLPALSELGLAYQNLGDNRNALASYKKVVSSAPNSQIARNAMIALKSLYVDMNDVDGYMKYAASSGIETDISAITRDSLSYAAAERIYLSNATADQKIKALEDYTSKFPKGIYGENALYYTGELYTLKDNRKAVSAFTSLIKNYKDETGRAHQRLASLYENQKDYTNAARIYRQLAEKNIDPALTASSWNNYVRTGIGSKDQETVNQVLDIDYTGKGLTQENQDILEFARAEKLRTAGDSQKAYAIYDKLASRPSSAQNAEAAYLMIEKLFNDGDLSGAETRVLRLAESNTKQTYWLGKSFLILGDIYMKKGDSFQARATLQSIVDGYQPANDGIVDEAKRKIQSLPRE